MLTEDQIGHSFSLPEAPKRIISLVPSQTELLFDLGLGDRVVGITKFCVHPKKWHQSKVRVGGTKNVDFEKIANLSPDLIIGNKEENTQSEILELQEKYPVYTSDIKTIPEALNFINAMGELFNKQAKAIEIAQNIKKELQDLQQVKGKVLYLIWKNPYMCAGSNTFIAQLLNRVGLTIAKTADTGRYPVLTENEIRDLNADYIFLSSEPFPFGIKHIEALQAVSNAKVVLVDGELFSWYGSRLLMFKAYWENTLMLELAD
ncbi:cobalamin-binding protein [Putridiphycobacter roseus]|uniref:Cobalamin-binding protein n=1 Tax=Putridiphycobacter roseus TaxID=2219161 RepID=A0A2W1NM30_9FLAO|nr:helical backbone metal receptor [Putridiphycobacter roseus]PZE16702.1 cobalamin-binding protein [Putridiphycobacter roseus]